MPSKTRFFFDSISFFIEKTQICLNLKLINDICNSIKKTRPGKYSLLIIS